jgi:hypothetical protein
MSLDSILQDQLIAIEAQLEAINVAITALLIDKVQSYTLDTGQTRQTVTKFDIVKLTATRDSLLNQYSVLCARLGIDGTIYAGGAW